jgi:hypothetical protein
MRKDEKAKPISRVKYETETCRNQIWPSASARGVLRPEAGTFELALARDFPRVHARQMSHMPGESRWLFVTCKEFLRRSTNWRNMHLPINQEVF